MGASKLRVTVRQSAAPPHTRLRKTVVAPWAVLSNVGFCFAGACPIVRRRCGASQCNSLVTYSVQKVHTSTALCFPFEEVCERPSIRFSMLDFIPAHRSTEGIVSGLKQALREAAHDSDQAQPQPSTAQLTLQVSALHNAFLALSDAFTESLGRWWLWGSNSWSFPCNVQLHHGVHLLSRVLTRAEHACLESLTSPAFALTEVSRRKELQWEAAMQAIQQRFASEVAAVEALRDDYHQLASKNAGLHKENCWLRARVEGLEGSISRCELQFRKSCIPQGIMSGCICNAKCISSNS